MQTKYQESMAKVRPRQRWTDQDKDGQTKYGKISGCRLSGVRNAKAVKDTEEWRSLFIAELGQKACKLVEKKVAKMHGLYWYLLEIFCTILVKKVSYI